MKKCVVSGLVVLLVGMGRAEDDAVVEHSSPLLWQDNSLTFLYGGNFKVDNETQQTFTLEHASGWSMGDLFIFVDVTRWDGEKDYKGDKWSVYGEVAPRLSLGKLLNKDLSVLFVKDFLVAACFEFGKNSNENALIGAGIDLDVPGFDFVQLNLYRRYNDRRSNPESYQLTPVWKTTIPVGATSIVFDGYIDWVFADDTRNLHINPQLKLDVGALVGMEAHKLYAGVEYDYWENKYGIPNANQDDALSALVKYHF